MTHFRVIPERSQLWIDARSDLHPIHGQGLGLEGSAEAVVGEDGQLDLGTTPTGRVELAVDRLTSGSALQDREMRRRIDAKAFPTIVAEIRQVAPGQAPGRYGVRSDITFHGVARRVPLELAASIDGGRTLVVEGQFQLDVRSFDINVPRLLGFKVYPDVTVRVRVVLEPH